MTAFEEQFAAHFSDVGDSIIPFTEMQIPNERIKVYEGEFLLKSGTGSYPCIGILEFVWFPSPGIQLSCEVALTQQLISDYQLNVLHEIIIGNECVGSVLLTISAGNVKRTTVKGKVRHGFIIGDRSIVAEQVHFEIPNFSHDLLGSSIKRALRSVVVLTNKEKRVTLSPAYDLLCTKLAMPHDLEEMALTINAKKRKLQRKDFDLLATTLKIPDRSLANIYRSFANKFQNALEWVNISFLSNKMQTAYKELMQERFRRLGLL